MQAFDCASMKKMKLAQIESNVSDFVPEVVGMCISMTQFYDESSIYVLSVYICYGFIILGYHAA